jgi:hypothetical protein
MRQELPSSGGFYRDTNLHWTAQDCLNYLPVRAERAGTRTEFMLRQAPGVRPLMSLPNGGAVRGLRNVEGKLFAVAGTQLYQVTPALNATARGTVPGAGRVSMAHNQAGAGNEVAIDNGSARYVYDTATLAFGKVTDEAFPGSFMAFYIDQFLGFIEPLGRYWGHSDLADANSYSSLDRYEAEADPDRIVSAYVSHREVLIFGKDTIEPFVNTGAATGTFERAANTVVECGCSARFSVAGMDNSVFFLDDKRIVRRLDGYTPVRISTPGVEQALGECTAAEISRAYAYVWEDRGHKVYYLTVPGRFTFGYDLLSGEWARRGTGDGPWRLTDLVFWNDQWIGGDAQGRLYVLDWDYFFDGADALVRERVSGVLADNQNPVTVNEIELLFGVGGQTGQLVNPKSWIALHESGVSYAFEATAGSGGSAALVGDTVTVTNATQPGGNALATITFSGLSAPLAVRLSVASYTGTINGADLDGPASFVIGSEATDNTTVSGGGVYAAFTPAEIEGEVTASYPSTTFAGMVYTPVEGVPRDSAVYSVEVYTAPEVTAQSYDRKVQIAVSRDGGHNWNDWRERSLGEIGEYRKRVRFSRLGQGVQLVMKTRVTSPIRADFMGLVADLEPGE